MDLDGFDIIFYDQNFVIHVLCNSVEHTYIM